MLHFISPLLLYWNVVCVFCVIFFWVGIHYIIIIISGQILAREWTKYDCGVFTEQGFKNDRLYPDHFKSGNFTIETQGRILSQTCAIVRVVSGFLKIFEKGRYTINYTRPKTTIKNLFNGPTHNNRSYKNL